MNILTGHKFKNGTVDIIECTDENESAILTGANCDKRPTFLKDLFKNMQICQNICNLYIHDMHQCSLVDCSKDAFTK